MTNSLKFKDLPIYIIHYKKMVDRKQYLSSWLEKHNKNAFWITDPEREDLTDEMISKYYDSNMEPPEWSIYPKLNRNLLKGEIACSIAHLNAYKHAVENNYENIMVLEDDCQFIDNFISIFDSLFSNCPKNYDAIFLGSCCGLVHPDKPANISPEEAKFFKKLPPLGRCAFSIVLSQDCCKKILDRCVPFNYPMDWQAYVIASQHKTDPFDIYWVEPPITIDSGTNSTTLR